jgi:hypothetical protein
LSSLQYAETYKGPLCETASVAPTDVTRGHDTLLECQATSTSMALQPLPSSGYYSCFVFRRILASTLGPEAGNPIWFCGSLPREPPTGYPKPVSRKQLDKQDFHGNQQMQHALLRAVQFAGSRGTFCKSQCNQR